MDKFLKQRLAHGYRKGIEYLFNSIKYLLSGRLHLLCFIIPSDTKNAYTIGDHTNAWAELDS